MTTTDTSNSVSNAADIFAKISGKTEAAKSKAASENDKNKADFMKLMIAQLKNQDPLSPQDGGAFLSQLAQFSTVEGIDKVNGSLSSLSTTLQSNQALQATSMVGRTVQVKGATGQLPVNGSLSGTVELPASTSNLRVNVYGKDGALVRQFSLGPQAGGDLAIHWNGLNAAGQPATPGMYKVVATAEYGGKSQQLQTYMGANVDSVTLNSTGGVTLNVAGVGPVQIGDVKQIN